MTQEPKRLNFSFPWLSPYLSREPVTLAVLTGLAVALFLAVGGLSRLYHAQQQSLAERWADRGVNDLNAGHYKVAITEFRTALLYERDNGAYQLSLAQALLGLKRTDEAYAYLINLWERQPENGVVNLELARIAAARNETSLALRFYHNAIYATWPGEQEGDQERDQLTERREARLELINYLLASNARTQAESELIAIEANVGDDAAQQVELGKLFLRVEDYGRALAAFRASLKLDRANPAADAGAGVAEFEMGQYAEAQRSLEEAVDAKPDDTASAALLKTTQEVLRIDPYRPQISDRERDRIVVDAFTAAGDRLKSCQAQGTAAAMPAKAAANGAPQLPKLAGAPGPASPPGLTSPPSPPGPPAQSWQDLSGQWSALQPQMTESGLRQDPDLLNAGMNLAFQIEHKANGACGAASDADQALLLIAGQHEEN